MPAFRHEFFKSGQRSQRLARDGRDDVANLKTSVVRRAYRVDTFHLEGKLAAQNFGFAHHAPDVDGGRLGIRASGNGTVSRAVNVSPTCRREHFKPVAARGLPLTRAVEVSRARICWPRSGIESSLARGFARLFSAAVNVAKITSPGRGSSTP